MKLSTLFSLALCLAMGSGCAEKKVILLVPATCLTGPIRLENCDMASPPRCKQSKIAYRKGCESVVIEK